MSTKEVPDVELNGLAVDQGCLDVELIAMNESDALSPARSRLGGNTASFELVSGSEEEGEQGRHAEQQHWVPRLLQDVRDTPRSVANYYIRLSDAFGWRFVALVSIVYGLNQGVGEEFYGTASQYFFSDVPPKGLGLQPDRVASIDGFANVPWQIKSVYGIVSDTFPINDFHRKPYIVGAGFLGMASWTALWLWPGLTASLAGLLLFLGNLSVASPDVMIDASVAEKSKTHSSLASDMQTLCWASFGIGKIFSAASSGWLYDSEWCGRRGLFGLTVVTSALMVFPAKFGWLNEVRASERKSYRAPTEQDGPEGIMLGGLCCKRARGKLAAAFADQVSPT